MMMTAPPTSRPRKKNGAASRAANANVAPPGGVLLAPSYVLGLPSAGSYVSIPGISAYDFGTGDFTFEVWCMGAQGGPLLALAGASGAILTVSIAPSGDISVIEGTATVLHVNQPTLAADGAWHQVAVSRASGTLTIYVDGVELASGAETMPFSISGATSLLLGAASTAANAPTYIGNYADVRVWNTSRTQAQVQQNMCYRLPSGTQVTGYWTFAAQSLTDYSSNQNSGGTLNGGAAYTFVPINYFPSIGCLQLTGSASSVSISGNAAYNVGTGDFTIEAWVQPYSSGAILARTAPSGSGTAGFSLSITTTGGLSFTTSDGTHTTTVTQSTPQDDFLTNWHHVAVTRQSGTITIYADGIPVASAAESTPISINVPAAAPLVLGHTQAQVSSIVSPARALVRTQNAPPLPQGTAPYTLQIAEVRMWQSAIGQDQLYRGMLIESHGNEPGLLGYWNFCRGSVTDISNTRNLTASPYSATIGTPGAPIALAQYVLNLPGTAGSYMAAPSSSAMDFGTGDFTIEMRFSATGAGTLLSRPFDSSTPSCGMQVRVAATTMTLTLSDGQHPATFTANVSLLDGNWHHIAWVRTAGVMSFFADDLPAACTPAQSTQNITTPANVSVGALYDSASQTYSDYVTGTLDFVYLWNTARQLADLQLASFLQLGAVLAQTVAAWTFDQQAPLDQSGNNSNGVLGSTASIAANTALPATVPLSVAHLPGGTSFIDCSARTDLSFGGLQPYTFGAWIKPMAAQTTGSIISRYDASGTSEYRLRLVNGIPVAERAASGGTVTGVTALQPDWWYFVSMTYDGKNLAVQVNGITENSAAVGAITAATPTHVLIGASANGTGTTDNLMGCVQSVQAWTSALDTSALQQQMFARLTGTETGLQAYWNFLYATSVDWTGHGAAGTLTQNARYQATTRWSQQLRGGLSLDGNGAYINCGGGRSLNVKGPMTLEAWIRPDSFTGAWQTIAAKGSVYQIRRYNTTNQITFSTQSLSSQELPSTQNVNLLDGQWHHVAAVYDGQNKYLYIDGQLNASAAATGNISVGNGVLYFADNDGEVIVVDQETGNEIWTARVFKPIQTPPVTDKNVMCVSSPSGDIFAFDYSTRQRLWDCQIPQGYQVPLTIHRDVVYFSGAGTAISAVDLLTGNLLWNMNGMANQAAPTIAGDTAYYCAQNSVFARNLISGRINWVYNLQDATIGAPTLLDNTAFVNCADNNVYALILGKVTTPGGSFQATSTLIGSPIVENGLIYVVTTDGTITALSYSSASQAFTTSWTAKIAAGITQAISVDYPYVAAIGNDNALYVYNAVTGVQLWKYTSGTSTPVALSGLTVVNGAAYVSGADGNYSALDLENQAVLWTKDLQTVATASAAVTYAPFCIGASVDEQGTVNNATFDGLIAEVRLWDEARSAKDIATTYLRKVVGDEPALAGYWSCANRQVQEPDLSPHMNPGAYTGNICATLVDLQLADPLPRILAQAQMMQNWTPADQASNNKDGQVAFCTAISLIDGTGSPLVGAGIKVFTDAPTTISIAGVSYQVDNTHAAEVWTDARGMISVVTPCNQLTSSTLQIWTDFMAADERVIIHPDENLSGTLGSIQGADLINPSQSTNPLIKDKPPLLQNVTQAQANGLASAINNAVQNVKKPATQPSRYMARPRAVAVGDATVQGDVVSQGIVLSGSEPYAQYVGPGAIPNWQFNFQNYQFNPLSSEELEVIRATRATNAVLMTGEEGFWDLWDDFVNGVKQAANVVIEVIGDAVKIVVQWVNTGIQTLEHVFQSVAEVGQAIFGIFKQLLSDIVDAAKKIYEFFAFLFEWDDILNTKNALIGYLRQVMNQVGTQIDQFIAQEQAFFDKVESQVDDAFETIIGRLGKQSLGQMRDSAPSSNPILPSVPLPSGSNFSAQMRAAQDSQAVFGTEGNWLVSTTIDNSGGGSGGSVLQWSNDAMSYIAQALEEIGQLIGTSKAVAAFQSAFQYFAQIASNPEALLQLVVQGLLEAVKGLAELTIEIAKAAFTLLLKAVKMFIDIMWDALAEPIEIPVISWLYEQISGSSLSMLDLIALIAAVPTTIIYKAFTGEAPFKTSQKSGALAYQATAGAQLEGWQKGLKTAQAVLQLLSIPISIILDIQEVTPVETTAAGAGPGQTIHTVQPWAGRIDNLFKAVSLKTATSPKLGPAIFRWLNFGMKLFSQAFGAPWLYSSSPTDFEKYAWLFYTIELVVVEFVFALYTQITSLTWMTNAFGWAIPTGVGLFRFIAVIVATAVSDNLPSTGSVVSSFFSPVPSMCKFLRSTQVVAATEGVSIGILALVDLIFGVVPPMITIGSTWA